MRHVKEDPSHISSVRTQRRIWGLTYSMFVFKERIRTPKGEMGQVQRGTDTGMIRHRVFKTGSLLYSPRWYRLMCFWLMWATKDNRLIHKSSHSSVHYNWEICMDRMFEPIMGSGLPISLKGTAVQGTCARVGEASLWLVCIHCVPRAYTAMLGKFFSGLVLCISVSFLLHWGGSG